jgi:transposase
VLSLAGSARVFLARSAVDFRKAHDGLVAIVREVFRDDPLSGDLFVFLNRRRDRIKVLVWDRNGFWLMYKRLERGTFERLALPDDAARVEIDRARLHMLLEGVTLKSLRFRRNFTPRVSISARLEHDAAAAR